jgi:methylenetetrahydrofolate dehydrogenase (NADP+)/methenyltetrahydrofolate cyclohydrolase
VAYEVRALEPGWTQAKIVELIRDLNRDPQVSGITVHTPLPAGVDQDAVMGAIAPSKDIEGIHPENLGPAGVRPPSSRALRASAAVELARIARPSFKGLDAVVVGRSALVGKAIALLCCSRRPRRRPRPCATPRRPISAPTRAGRTCCSRRRAARG